ncbi:beta-glucosidase [Emericellopsis cladophorae]|uniref:beta-glucosidase n=1 Tax=Emericellopsis cladophorae TaxID=2686198 RepID=A0A9P9Y2G6_9HYPO|nr:beta-glucosidase [Emericellopsis cladophorae]KAI6781875.1 beta-glucosidase [Emericellopsis cladophorae]
MPAGGRNWEGFGSDPYLQGIACAETIKGIQDQHVMATIKHFVGNEQEHFRQAWEWGLPNAISSNIDDRTMHEIYAWPFGDAVKAGVASVMCSYNQVNNSYACGNSKLLNGILKDELGFQGFVMSDWLAQRSGVASALAGLDMTMPGDGLGWADGKSLWGPKLSQAVLNGSLPLDRLDDMVTRIVASWYQLGQDNHTLFDATGPNFSSFTEEKMGVTAPGSPTEQSLVEVNKFVDVQADHAKIAQEIAIESIVMLKNERDWLPMSRNAEFGVERIPWKNKKLKVGIFGEDAGPGEGPNACPDRGCNQGTLAMGWGSGAVELPYLITPAEALQKGFNASRVEVTKYLANDLPGLQESRALEGRDVCIVFANSDAGEGFVSWNGIKGDRNDLRLQKGGDELILEVADKCGGGKGKTIVVYHAVGPVLVDKWINHKKIKAVFAAHLPGQESGNAIASIIFGDESPSGKLPYTMAKRAEDYGDGGEVMYTPNDVVPQQDFTEGIYIDYRWLNRDGLFPVDPQFSFAYGLQYTGFSMDNIQLEVKKPKSAFPAPRPAPGARPPVYNGTVPPVEEALWPKDIRRLDKYIYPYIDSAADIRHGHYPYPKGYDTEQPLSGAGGDEGGNPDLWETYAVISVEMRNSGKFPAKAVPQLWLSYPPNSEATVDFPKRVLRGFDKFYLKPGQSKKVEFPVTRRDLSYWNVEEQNWLMLTKGNYVFSVGLDERTPVRQILW